MKESGWARGREEAKGAQSPHHVARRNARERRRVQAVNSAFARLRRLVPLDRGNGKRTSKVKTLQRAIEYISGLLTLLRYHRHWESNLRGSATLQFEY